MQTKLHFSKVFDIIIYLLNDTFQTSPINLLNVIQFEYERFPMIGRKLLVTLAIFKKTKQNKNQQNFIQFLIWKSSGSATHFYIEMIR